MSQQKRRTSRKGTPPATANPRPSGARRRWVSRGIYYLGYAWFISLYGAVVLGMLFLGATLAPYRLAANTYNGPTTIYSSDGQVLAKLYAEYRVPVALHEVPAHTVHAMLAAEDTRFFTHRGLDFRGIARALWYDIRSGSFAQGGSTITQQLVRYELLEDQRTLPRKIREMALAVRVERAQTKEEILERYLNAVYFGGGAYGIGAAAETFFGKDVSQLTVAESALLAGLIRAPEEGNPRANMTIAVRRQHATLATMEKQGWLTADEVRAAEKQVLRIRERKGNRWRHPYVVEAVRQELLKRYGKDVVYHGGLTVYTTINSGLQTAGERALARAVRQGGRQHVGNGALVAIDPRNGYIRTLVGGKDFWQSQYNRALQAHRQPGSAFKVFVYQAALDQGYSLSDLELDAPITLDNWSPKNYGNHYYGVVTLRTALARSLNSVAVRLVRDISPYAVIVAAREAGISGKLQPNLTIALGSSEVTPVDMAHAFATYANGGRSVEPVLITQVRFNGKVIFQHTPLARQRVNPTTAFLLTQGLKSVLTEGTGRRARIGRPAAGKTGTSSRYRDAWFVGYTPYLSTAVWLGNDNRKPMAGVAGGSLPAQAWAEYMLRAHRGLPKADFAVPDGLASVTLCSDSGMLALPTCPHTYTEYMPIDRVPTQSCLFHYYVDTRICSVSGLRARADCPATLQGLPYDEVPTQTCTLDHHQPATPTVTNTPPSGYAPPLWTEPEPARTSEPATEPAPTVTPEATPTPDPSPTMEPDPLPAPTVEPGVEPAPSPSPAEKYNTADPKRVDPATPTDDDVVDEAPPPPVEQQLAPWWQRLWQRLGAVFR